MVVSSLFSHLKNACCAFFFFISIPFSLTAADGGHKDCPDQRCLNQCGINNCQSQITSNTELLLDMINNSAPAIRGEITNEASQLLFQLVNNLSALNGITMPSNLEGLMLQELGAKIDNLISQDITTKTTNDLNAQLKNSFGKSQRPCLNDPCCNAVESAEDISLSTISANLAKFSTDLKQAIGVLSAKYQNECHSSDQASVASLFSQFNNQLNSDVTAVSTNSNNNIIAWSDDLINTKQHKQFGNAIKSHRIQRLLRHPRTPLHNPNTRANPRTDS